MRGRIAGGLAHGQKQWLEIGMLLAQEPKLLLVDEPVAGMTDAETQQTAELLKEINRERTVVVVEHDMDFVAQIAGEGNTRLAGQHPVEQNQVGQHVADEILRLLGVVCPDRAMSRVLKIDGDELRDGRLILHDENAAGHWHL